MKWTLIAAALVAAVLIPIAYVLARALTPLASAHAALLGALALALGLLAALGGLRILFAHGRLAAARARQAEIVSMQNGHPIHIADVTLLAAQLLPRTLDRHYDVEQVRAATSPALTHYHNEVHAAPAPPLDQLLSISGPPAPPQLAAPPTDLAGAIARGDSAPDRWLIGRDAAGQPQQARLHHTGMIAISGVPGTGKTSTAAWLAAQTAAHGGALFVADPHHGDAESLSARLGGFAGAVERVAVEPDAINAMILQVAKIYDWRSAHPGVATTPILLLIDEFMQLMLRRQISDEAERALAVLSGGGRKKAIFGALISQNWSAAAMGQRVTVLRQIVTGSLVHQSDEATAKFLLPPSYASAAATLAPGEALWFGSGAPIQVRVPLLSDADVAYVAARQPARPGRLAAAPPTPATPPTPPASSSGPIAPTARVAAAPAPAERPTVALPPPTVKDQILMLLEARGGQWLTHAEMAAALAIDVGVIQVEAKELYDAGVIERRATRRAGQRVEYTTNQSTSATGALRYAQTA